MSIPTSTPGRTIGGRYALLGAVGAGGMGTVWRGHDQLLRRDVAVKEVLLPPGVPRAEHQMLCERTLREARAAAALNNPAVVRIYDVVEEDDRPWIVMELVAARSLAEIINETGPLRPELVADVGMQVLGALEAAHAAGILHRDVKPGNILLSADGRATLTDFGVARTSGDSALTGTGLLLGSPAYIPPERARGGSAVPASDLWSLGATLYAAVEGHPPYGRGDPLPTLAAIVSDPPPPFTYAGPLRTVLTGLLEKDPEHRWDVRRARGGFRDALGIGRVEATSLLAVGAARPPPAIPAGSAIGPGSGGVPSRRRHARTALALAVVLVLVLVLAGVAGAGGYYLTRQRSPATSPAAPSPVAATTPAGYFRFDHPDGFSIAVPSGWEREVLTPSGVIQFRDPVDKEGGGRFLRLQAAETDLADVEAHWRGAHARTKEGLQGYQLVDIRKSRAGSRPSADWEFTHTLAAHRHVIDRGFIIGGMVYSVYLSTREEQFAASRHLIDTVASSFDL